MSLRKFTLHMIPGGVLAAAALWLLHFWTRPPEVTAFLPLVPALVFLVGLLLGWRFNRSRLVYALLALAVADLCLKGGGEGGPPVREAVGVLLPLNLLLIAGYAERGLFSTAGALRFALLAVQPFLLLFLHGTHPQQILAAFSTPLFLWPRPLFPALPHPVLAATVLAGLVLLLRAVRRPAAMEAGFFWALVCAAAPLLAGVEGSDLTLWFAAGGVILTAALIEASHAMAFRDELTGLPSRRALNEELLKMGGSYVVAMVDVDHFKKVNDTHGHDVGDQVLKMVASRLGKVTGGGRPFRYGGEEFTLLFPGRTLKEALPHLEGVREAIEASPFILRHPSRPKKKPAGGGGKVGSARLSITVSVGASERRGGCGAEAVIKSADQALYKAKRGGRNRVCVQAVRQG